MVSAFRRARRENATRFVFRLESVRLVRRERRALSIARAIRGRERARRRTLITGSTYTVLANAATGCFVGEPVGVVAAASAGGVFACVSRGAPAFRFRLRNAIMARIGEIDGGRRGREARRCGRDAARRDRETRATLGCRCAKWVDGSPRARD